VKINSKVSVGTAYRDGSASFQNSLKTDICGFKKDEIREKSEMLHA
jgi:hypothetical protein